MDIFLRSVSEHLVDAVLVKRVDPHGAAMSDFRPDRACHIELLGAAIESFESGNNR